MTDIRADAPRIVVCTTEQAAGNLAGQGWHLVAHDYRGWAMSPAAQGTR